jgi:PAS domain S-box-containing protein
MIDEVTAGAVEQSGSSSAEVARALGVLVPMAVVDEDGRLRSVNRRWCAVVGRSAADVVGARWDEIIQAPAGLPGVTPEPRRLAARSFDGRVELGYGGWSAVTCEVAPLGEGPHHRRWLMVVHASTELGDDPAPPDPGPGEPGPHLRRALDYSADLVTILEPDGSWRSTQTHGAAPASLPEDLFAGDDPLAAVHPEDRGGVGDALAELRDLPEGSVGHRFEFRARGADGRWRWLETRGARLVEDPAVRGVVLHSRDVTEPHEAAEELSSMASRLTSLVSNLFVGVVMADEHDELIFANRAASEMFGLGPEPERLTAMAGGRLTAHLQRLHRDSRALDRIGEIVANRALVMEERVEFTNGRTLARSFVPILDDGAYRGHLWLYRDLTDEIAVAAEREYLLKMEKEQNARLTELDSLKSDLVASVSHELRTPLTSIVSFTHLLRDGLGADSVADQAEFLDIITRNTDRLLRLVDDLLLLDRLESNSLQVSNEWVDFPSLVEIAVSSIRPAARDKGITLVSEAEAGPPLVGDVDRLGQLIDNLLANAVKFTPAKGQVRTEVTRLAEGWRLVVSDTGIGIPMDEQHELFQRFYRASNARQASASGSGLGLLIALRITELHQGTIQVRSVEGRGTTVTVELRGAARPSLPPSPLSEAASQ